jgi:hypothetical protein
MRLPCRVGVRVADHNPLHQRLFRAIFYETARTWSCFTERRRAPLPYCNVCAFA